ncbi:ABC transporter permease, partial [Rhizobiaceae sp. 2RAB30]
IGLTAEPLQLAHNVTGTVIAMTQIMLPYFILPLYVSFRRIDRGMMNAAAGLGATPIRVFWTITLPQARSGLLAGGFLVFVLCFGFYVTPAILGGGRVIMMAQAINTYLGLYPNWGAAGALATVLFLCTLLTLGFMRLCMVYLTRKRTTSRA